MKTKNVGLASKLGYFVAPFLAGMILFLHVACGGKTNEEGSKTGGGGVDENISPTPFATSTPIPTVTSSGSVFGSGFWIASSSQMFISRYDTNGNLVQPVIDLKKDAGSVGGITALHMLDQSTLLAVGDTGQLNGLPIESIYSVALQNVTNAKLGFGVSTWKAGTQATLLNKSIRSLITGLVSGIVMIPATDKVYKVEVSSTDGSRTLLDTEILSKTQVSGCNYDEISNTTLLNSSGQKSVLLLSSGSVKTLNVLKQAAGDWACNSAYNYSTDGVTTTAHVPMNAVQTSDGKIYVLYAHPTDSQIVRYSFDGTSLSAPKTVFTDQSLLGDKPMGLAARSADRLLFGSKTRGRVFEVNVAKEEYQNFFIGNSYVNDVSVIISN